MESLERQHKLKRWIEELDEISQEFPGNNVNIDTVIRSFNSQLKEIEKTK